ncbi:ADP-ribose diphosphatase [Paenibacillus sp. J31TS4]|uniref:NUDIX domain-containing protein n=1 Tax=Paenibacillus sp. J31TS4 TaxID=2807195 RepID=UPI001B2A2731|nr:NUDIX hydrolase [Paenibacillus sp. J31TS4]GIP37560.1 ADP-ribose diphosphatase [Paenibacillus sp. J31TS4]
MNNKFEEKTIKTDTIFEGRIITVQVEEVELPNGSVSTREIVRHPGAVCVLALKGDRMLVVEQYRKALGRSQVEIPAGKLEPGEDPEAAIRRELEEETGYSCVQLRRLHSFYTSPGFADELIHLYLAEDLKAGEARPDEDEFLEVEELTFDEAKRYIAEGRISDAKTIMAVYAWQVYRITGEAQ